VRSQYSIPFPALQKTDIYIQHNETKPVIIKKIIVNLYKLTID